MPVWELTEQGYTYDSVDAASAEEALTIAHNNVDQSNYSDASDAEGTIWIDIRVHCPETGESERDTVTLNAKEPNCLDDEIHDWQSPLSLVGGIESNPGTWGHGGGVIIVDVCLHCGCKRITDTWAQRRDTGEQGLESVSYEANAFSSEELDEVKNA